MGAIRTVTGLDFIAPNDDNWVGVSLGFTVRLGNESYSTGKLHNNGIFQFANASVGDHGFSPYTPTGDVTYFGVDASVVYMFWADVDTRTGNVVHYGTTTIDGRRAFVANYIDVGYFNQHTDKLNSFQLIIYDVPAGFEIELNYDKIQWETGDASDGVDGFGGASALMGVYLPTVNVYFFRGGAGDWPNQVAIPGSLLDNDFGLIHFSRDSPVRGRYVFRTASKLKLSIGNTWQLVGTPDRPLMLKMPDGSWVTNPRLLQKQPDGTWLEVVA